MDDARSKEWWGARAVIQSIIEDQEAASNEAVLDEVMDFIDERERAVREPLESRLEAYETTVREYLRLLDASQADPYPEPEPLWNAEARLRELSESREA